MTLVVTALSYKTFRARARVLSFTGAEATKNIRLETEFVALPEVIVLSDIGLRGLMKRVVARIPENYGTDRYLLKAYHRSYFASETDFARLNEAYVVIEDDPYPLRARRPGSRMGEPVPQPRDAGRRTAAHR
jgi:hypothetical protein